jgi:hypothetical protein
LSLERVFTEDRQQASNLSQIRGDFEAVCHEVCEEERRFSPPRRRERNEPLRFSVSLCVLAVKILPGL